MSLSPKHYSAVAEKATTPLFAMCYEKINTFLGVKTFMNVVYFALFKNIFCVFFFVFQFVLSELVRISSYRKLI